MEKDNIHEPDFIAFAEQENLGRNDLDFLGNADVLFWKQSSFDLFH